MKLKVPFSHVIFLIFILMPIIAFSASTNVIREARLSSSATSPRLVLETSQKPVSKIFTLTNPDRLVIDIQNTTAGSQLARLNGNNPLIKNIRTSKLNNTYRIVADLKQRITLKAMLLKPDKTHSYRLVIDIKPLVKLAIATPKITTHKPLRDIVVVIDPGHGGHDPGATGKRGTHEKDVVLSIGRDLRDLVDKQPGMKAVMTRSSDKYYSLRDRLRIARNNKADIFIAIHADAFKNRSARGASVFALSSRGASSEAARWLANRENSSELMGGTTLEDKSVQLRSLLLDLSQTATINSSIVLGGDILSSLKTVARLHKSHVERAGFVVLKSPDIPSVLVETGFLSNSYEESKLRTSSYRLKIAKAIMAGIRKYFYKRPPPGTWLASQAKATKYVVARGDSLSKIARAHGTTTSSIMRENRLRTQTIHPGQVLTLPRRT